MFGPPTKGHESEHRRRAKAIKWAYGEKKASTREVLAESRLQDLKLEKA